MFLILLLDSVALACGGFLCSGGTFTGTTGTTTTTQTGTLTGEAPVTQKSERILFHVEPDGWITTYVEVSYVQNVDVDFAWLIPLPEAITAADVSTASADLFNELEKLTAPRFTFSWEEQVVNEAIPDGTYGGGYGYGYGGLTRETRSRNGFEDSRGCGLSSASLGCRRDTNYYGKFDTTIPTDLCADGVFPPCDSDVGYQPQPTVLVSEEVAVEVLDEAVVGPFAIEVVQASDTPQFAEWLTERGYDLPDNAVAPIQHYIDMAAADGPTTTTDTGPIDTASTPSEGGPAAFLGVRLAPDVPEGPIDTLVFRYRAEAPMIPLILTAIATCPNLPVVTYIVGDEYWGPANWGRAGNPADETRPTADGGVDYEARLDAAVDAFNGQAFVIEYRDTTDQLDLDPELFDLRAAGARISRLRGAVAPQEMTLDPVFGEVDGDPIRRDHDIFLEDGPPAWLRRRSLRRRSGGSLDTGGDTGGSGAWLLFPMLGLLRRRRSVRGR